MHVEIKVSELRRKLMRLYKLHSLSSETHCLQYSINFSKQMFRLALRYRYNNYIVCVDPNIFYTAVAFIKSSLTVLQF